MSTRQGNAERFSGQYKIARDGFPQSIGQGNVCVVFRGNKDVLSRLNKPSPTLKTIEQYDVTLVTIEDTAGLTPELMAVVYNQNGNRSMTWYESEGVNKLAQRVKQLQKTN